VIIFFAALSVKAQYMDGPDRYFYEEDFDWRWDVRVRISDGVRSGYLTNREANRLYRRLEDIERKEWAFQSDGYYSTWEQDEIWMDVVDLNRAIGLELSDWDRRYYGYTGMVLTGPLHWYFGPSYDFYRFDRRGYGTIRLGYAPRNYYPVKHVYYTHRNNYSTHWGNRPERIAVPSRSSAGNRDYPARRVESSRSMNPDRESTSGRSSRSTNSDRYGSYERRMESSRANTPERGAASGREMESSRSSAPNRSMESGRLESSRMEAPRVESPRMESPRVEAPRRESGMESRSSGRTSPGSSVERSGSRSGSADRPSGSVESRGSSRSSGVSPSDRSSRSEGSSSARSSSSRGSRSRD